MFDFPLLMQDIPAFYGCGRIIDGVLELRRLAFDTACRLLMYTNLLLEHLMFF